MRTALTILACVSLLIFESLVISLFGLDVWVPWVAVGIAVYLALEQPLAAACAAMFVVGWSADLISLGPPGARAMALTLTFFALRLGAARLEAHSPFVRLLIAIAGAVILQVIEVALTVALGGPASLFVSMFLGGLPAALTAPLGLIAAWALLSRVDRFFADRKNASMGTLSSR